MKLVNFTHNDRTAIGLVVNNQVAELGPAFDFYSDLALNDRAPLTMLRLLQEWENAFDEVNRLKKQISSDLAEDKSLPFLISQSDIKFNAPIDNPGKIICMGLNYADHCREQNLPVPENIVLFAKFPTCILGPGEIITWPEGISEQVDYEAELAVVIGKECRNVQASQAMDVIAGFMVANDVSARDVQFNDKQWVRGKSFDTFCPIGPYLVTRDEIDDPQNLAIRCWVNGDIRQDSNTGEMIFQIPEAIEFISRTSTLLPGDIILTGTPDGVGVFRDPKVFLKKGDRVEIEIEKLGRLENPVG